MQHLNPTLDYVVSKIPRFPFDKFEKGERVFGHADESDW